MCRGARCRQLNEIVSKRRNYASVCLSLSLEISLSSEENLVIIDAEYVIESNCTHAWSQ